MTPSLAWQDAYRDPVIALLTMTVVTLAHFYGGSASSWKAWLERRNHGDAQAWSVHLQRLSGALLFGLIPALVALFGLSIELSETGLGAGDGIRGLCCIGGALLLLPIVARASGKPSHLRVYPQIRSPLWSRRLLLANALGWALYLLAYEYLFRGFLLYTLAASFGAWPAILIMTALYVCVHLPKPAQEAIACLPMGIVFALVTLWCGALWPAIVIHIMIALTGDSFALRAHPEMRLEV